MTGGRTHVCTPMCVVRCDHDDAGEAENRSLFLVQDLLDGHMGFLTPPFCLSGTVSDVHTK